MKDFFFRLFFPRSFQEIFEENKALQKIFNSERCVCEEVQAAKKEMEIAEIKAKTMEWKQKEEYAKKLYSATMLLNEHELLGKKETGGEPKNIPPVLSPKDIEKEKKYF